MDSPGEILSLCRLCLVKDQVNIPIFDEQGDIRQIFLKISSCLPVTITRHDQLPKRICDACSNKLDLLYEFWNSSASAEKTLLSWLGQAGVKDAGEKISAVAQQIAKPAETLVKEESESLEDSHMINESQDSFEDQSLDEGTKDEAEAPPPKRARRTAAVKAQINITPESDEDEDDDFDAGEAMTKIEDESDESESELKDDPSYSEVPGTSADDQAGPSGVGKDGVEAPPLSQELVDKFDIRDCMILVADISQDPTLKFRNGTVKVPRFKYKCYVCSTRFFTSVDVETHRATYRNKDCKYLAKLRAGGEEKKKRKGRTVRKPKQVAITETADYIKDSSEDGSVFSCKHCWKVFLTKYSLQQHINWHYELSEIDTVAVKTFYKDYALLRPDVDPFLPAKPDNSEETAKAGPSNNNTAFEVNMNLNLEFDKNAELIKGPAEDAELEWVQAEAPVSQHSTSSALEKTICVKQPPSLYVNREHFRCSKCDNLFLALDSFNQHILKEKCSIIGKCCICREPFVSNQQLHEHFICNHIRHRCICNFCFKTFVSFENRQKHMMKKHHYF